MQQIKAGSSGDEEQRTGRCEVMDEEEEPKAGSAPAVSLLRGTYNQTYLICKLDMAEAKAAADDDEDVIDAGGVEETNGSYQERRVLFRCGNWCYTGNVTLEKSRLSLEDVVAAIPMLQRQQNRLHFHCCAASVPRESQFFDALAFVGEATDFAASELASARVHGELAKWSDVHTWLEDPTSQTYFEFELEAPTELADLALAATKTYAQGLIFITVYFEGALYVVVQDGEGAQPLLDVKFPDVSRPGRGIHLCSYRGQPWRKLTLWNAAKAASKPRPTPPRPKTLSLSSDAYVQTYVILKSVAEAGTFAANPHHEVLFRFGSWCYSGSVQLTPDLDLADLPHVIPALRIQQSRLDFVCDINRVPTTSPFSRPLAYMARVAPHLQSQLLAAEAAIAAHVDAYGADVTEWLEGDPSQSFFEFHLDLSPTFLDRHLKNVELIASKSYLPSGVVVVAVFFRASLYVVLADNATEEPLLDSRFPNVADKGRGYLVAAHADGLPGWPELRKLTVWQTKLALGLELARRRSSEEAIAKENNEEPAPEEETPPAEDDAKDTKQQPLRAKENHDKPAAKAPDDDDDDGVQAKETASSTLSTRAEPKKCHPLLAPVRSASASKVNAPHRVPAVAALNAKLEKVRQQLSSSGAEAPWDEFGRPRNGSFSSKK